MPDRDRPDDRHSDAPEDGRSGGHVDPDDLALAALGEDGALAAGPGARHLTACPRCRDELAALRRVVGSGRGAPSPGVGSDAAAEPVVPPPSVWAGIAAATGVTAVPASLAGTRRGGADGTAGGTTGAVAEGEPAAGLHLVPGGTAGGTADDASGRGASHLRDGGRGSRRRTAWAAAAAGVLVGAAGAAAVLDGVSGSGASGSGAGGDVLAVGSTRLTPLVDGGAGAGEATLQEDGSDLSLRVEADGLPSPSGGWYEVWLLADAGDGAVALGTLPAGGDGRLVLPAGIDLADYPVVDVSLEPADGDPAHSGTSVLRGSLDA